jgi:hypothetical protein
LLVAEGEEPDVELDSFVGDLDHRNSYNPEYYLDIEIFQRLGYDLSSCS